MDYESGEKTCDKEHDDYENNPKLMTSVGVGEVLHRIPDEDHREAMTKKAEDAESPCCCLGQHQPMVFL